MGVPGWPLLAFCTASMESVRIVLMQRYSSFWSEVWLCASPEGLEPRVACCDFSSPLLVFPGHFRLGYSPDATFLC